MLLRDAFSFFSKARPPTASLCPARAAALAPSAARGRHFKSAANATLAPSAAKAELYEFYTQLRVFAYRRANTRPKSRISADHMLASGSADDMLASGGADDIATRAPR